jgi:hypothetical protein
MAGCAGARSAAGRINQILSAQGKHQRLSDTYLYFVLFTFSDQ